MAAGDFTASYLADVLIKQEELFADPRSNRELQHPVETAKAILENQMVRFAPTQDPPGVLTGRRSATVKAIWLKACRDNSVDLTDVENDLADCDITGDEIESDSLSLVANLGWAESFSVVDNKPRDTFTTQEKTARALAVAMLNLDKRINTAIISFLTANAMANLYTDTQGTIVGTVTNFDSADWTADLLAEFDLTAEFNEINNPLLINGTNLRNAVYNASFNVRNDDQRDQIAKFQAWNMFFDPRNIDSTVGAKASFLVDAGAMAFWTRNEYMNRDPQEIKSDLFAFSVPSRNLMFRDGNEMKPVIYDVYMQRNCVIANMEGITDRRIGNAFEVRVRYGLSLGPPDCNNGSGILEFHNVTAP